MHLNDGQKSRKQDEFKGQVEPDTDIWSNWRSIRGEGGEQGGDYYL